MDSKYSVVEYIPDNKSGSCGYCKSSNTSYNLGIWAHTLSVEDYQSLIDRGWRRSGQYCYKPSLTITCCPLYTIKCDALNLKLSKSQKKLLKRISNYLNKGLTSSSELKDCESDGSSENEPSGSNIYDKRMNKIIEEKSSENAPTLKEVDFPVEKDSTENTSSDCPTDIVQPCVPQGTTEEKAENRITDSQSEQQISESTLPLGNAEVSGTDSSSFNSSEKKCLKNPRPGLGMDKSKPVCKKAKLLRLENKKKKLEKKGLSLDNIEKKAPQEKSLEDYIAESNNENSVNKLELRTVRSSPRSKEFEETFEVEHALYQKYQMAIHNDPISKCTASQFTRFLITSPLKIRLLPSKCPKEILWESWKLFVKYQMVIHKETKDECSYDVFHSFIVESPLQPQKSQKGPSSGYGSFHQQYWLNGKLIAVGVIDILPKCVSSVYFFYDPDYSFLSLGTYGSLRELEFVRKLHESSPDISSYYMGYYIHSCPKMRYKARLSPSYLLCPEVYTWHPVEICQAKLEQSKYSRFNDDIDAVCEDSDINLNKVLVLWKQIAMPYYSYKMRAKFVGVDEDEEVKQYAELVGRKCAERMLLYRS